MDGKVWMKLMKPITYLHLESSIKGRTVILNENDFIGLYLNSNYKCAEIIKIYGISHHILTTSISYYTNKYLKEIKEKRHRSCSRSAFAKQSKNNPRPNEIKWVDKDKLKELITEGYSEWQIAKILEVAPQTIRKNVRSYNLKHPQRGVSNLTKEDWENIKLSDKLVPGIEELLYNGMKNPSEFFHLVYDVWIKILKIIWTFQRLSGRYNYHLYKGVIQRDHIAWRINKQEILVSEALRKENISHIREFLWSKRVGKHYSADIFIQNTHIIIEINGDVHNLDLIQKTDAHKIKLAKQLGYRLLVFSTKEVNNNLELVIRKIKQEINNEQ